ncbi:hypothetical protein BH23BAC4_BH23BAC4_16180 [soil metagenome]
MYRVFPLLLLLVAVPAVAQTDNISNAGSVYSRFGLGERHTFGSSQSDAMGGAGIALRSAIYHNLHNPAHSADLGVTTLGVQIEFNAVDVQNAAGEQSRYGAGGLGGLQIGVPLLQDRLGLSASFRPYSRVNYRTTDSGTFTGIEGENQRFVVNYEGGGGLQEIQGGLGLRLGTALQVGGRADVVFGVIDYSQRTDFPDGGNIYQTVRTNTSTNLLGVTGTVGAIYSARFGTSRMLTLGGTLTLPTRLSGERRSTFGQGFREDSLGVPQSGNVSLPMRAGFGLAYFAGPRWSLAADVEFEPWSKFESDFVFGGYRPGHGPGATQSELRDRFRTGVGAQFLPGGGDRQAAFPSRVAYRVGAYYEQGLASPDGSGINAQAVTLGFSLPTAMPTARIDLGFEAGTRGSTAITTEGRGLVRDLFFKGTLTLNFGERWFVRRLLG